MEYGHNAGFLSKHSEFLDNISVDEIDDLRDIALSNEPSSGYAKTLLRKLTGEEILMDVPDWNLILQNSQGNSTNVLSQEDGIESIVLYPNPVNQDKVKLSSLTPIKSIRIFDGMGNKWLENQKIDSEQIELKIEHLVSGIYYVEIKLEDGQTKLKKLVKH